MSDYEAKRGNFFAAAWGGYVKYAYPKRISQDSQRLRASIAVAKMTRTFGGDAQMAITTNGRAQMYSEAYSDHDIIMDISNGRVADYRAWRPFGDQAQAYDLGIMMERSLMFPMGASCDDHVSSVHASVSHGTVRCEQPSFDDIEDTRGAAHLSPLRETNCTEGLLFSCKKKFKNIFYSDVFAVPHFQLPCRPGWSVGWYFPMQVYKQEGADVFKSKYHFMYENMKHEAVVRPWMTTASKSFTDLIGRDGIFGTLIDAPSGVVLFDPRDESTYESGRLMQHVPLPVGRMICPQNPLDNNIFVVFNSTTNGYGPTHQVPHSMVPGKEPEFYNAGLNPEHVDGTDLTLGNKQFSDKSGVCPAWSKCLRTVSVRSNLTNRVTSGFVFAEHYDESGEPEGRNADIDFLGSRGKNMEAYRQHIAAHNDFVSTMKRFMIEFAPVGILNIAVIDGLEQIQYGKVAYNGLSTQNCGWGIRKQLFARPPLNAEETEAAAAFFRTHQCHAQYQIRIVDSGSPVLSVKDDKRNREDLIIPIVLDTWPPTREVAEMIANASQADTGTETSIYGPSECRPKGVEFVEVGGNIIATPGAGGQGLGEPNGDSSADLRLLLTAGVIVPCRLNGTVTQINKSKGSVGGSFEEQVNNNSKLYETAKFLNPDQKTVSVFLNST